MAWKKTSKKECRLQQIRKKNIKPSISKQERDLAILFLVQADPIELEWAEIIFWYNHCAVEGKK